MTKHNISFEKASHTLKSTKIGKLFFDVLPEDLKKKVSLNSFKS